MTASQLQLSFTAPGTVDPAAGERAKAAGMALAEAATAPSWADACDRAIETMAARGVPFQAADLVAEGLVDEPDDHHRWGPRFGAAGRRGIIQRAVPDRSKRATSRRSLLNTWIGTGAGGGEAA